MARLTSAEIEPRFSLCAITGNSLYLPDMAVGAAFCGKSSRPITGVLVPPRFVVYAEVVALQDDRGSNTTSGKPADEAWSAARNVYRLKLG